MTDLHKGLIDALNSRNDLEAKHILAMMHKPEFDELALGDLFICAAKNGNLEILRLLQEIWSDSLDSFLKKREEEDGVDSSLVMDGELKHQLQAREEYLVEACSEATSNAKYEAAGVLIKECGSSADVGLYEVLMDAVLDGKFDVVRVIAKTGIDVDYAGGMYEQSALYAAIEHDVKDAMEIFVEEGLDINFTEVEKNKTLLMRAAYFGAFDIVEYLVDEGADTTRLDKAKRTAYTHASLGNNNQSVINLLDKVVPEEYKI